MGKADKVPQLAEVFADDQKDQDSNSRETKRQEAAALVEDNVAERGIGALPMKFPAMPVCCTRKCAAS
jgi:hypothetical protein